jgi:hypothetical protein
MEEVNELRLEKNVFRLIRESELIERRGRISYQCVPRFFLQSLSDFDTGLWTKLLTEKARNRSRSEYDL